MRDLLIRYLLGELNEAESNQLEERLEQNPELRRELDYLRACFTEGGEASPAANDPPPDLAGRTSRQVSSLSADYAAQPQADATFSPIESHTSSASWSLADISVAAGVFLAVSMLLLPALRGSRDTSRRTACANNLRALGHHLSNYAENRNYYPRVGSRDCAGVFAYRLVADGYTTPEEMKRLVVCPASKQRDVYKKKRIVVTIPIGDGLATTEEIVQLVRVIPISYAYQMGYVEKDKYHCIRRPKACQPVLADAPRFGADGPSIANHNGCGINVLNADCSVRWQKCLTVAGMSDMLFLNDHYRAAAGRGPNDVVLGVSIATPSVEVVEAE